MIVRQHRLVGLAAAIFLLLLIAQPSAVTARAEVPETPIVYVGQDHQIWLTSLDGADPRRLTPDEPAIRYRWPRLSPDGTSVLVTQISSPPEAREQGDLWLLDLRGGEPRRLTQLEAVHRGSWGPDGRIALVSSHERLRLSVDLSQAPPRSVSPGQEWHRADQLYLLDPEDLSLRRLTDGLADYQAPVFSADGRWLYALKHFDPVLQPGGIAPYDRVDSQVIARSLLDGTEQVLADSRQLMPSKELGLGALTLAPRGGVYFATISSPHFRGHDLWHVALGQAPTRVASGVFDPAPFGAWLAVAYKPTASPESHIGQSSIVLLGPAGERRVLFEREGWIAHGPRWSPDGQWLVVSLAQGAGRPPPDPTEVPDGPGLWAIQVSTGELRRLAAQASQVSVGPASWPGK